MGNLLCIHVHAANIHDTKGGVYTFEKALYRYPTIQAGCADGGYRGTFRNTFDEFHNIRIDISMQIKEQKGFQVLPKRWVVERTFAWLNGSRRLSKDYETSCCSAETMIMISHAATLLKSPMNTSSELACARYIFLHLLLVFPDRSNPPMHICSSLLIHGSAAINVIVFQIPVIIWTRRIIRKKKTNSSCPIRCP